MADDDNPFRDERIDQIELATVAIDAIDELRWQLKGGLEMNTGKDATLAKAEYNVRGVRDELAEKLGEMADDD